MKFSENLQFYRKKYNLTQEEFAEKMDVSRQSVSKWESGASYPEMDKLLLMCEIFKCDLDTLLRSSATEIDVTKKEQYEFIKNRFAKFISLGVFLIICGVSIMMAINNFVQNDSVGVVVLLIFVVIAVMIFVIHGMLLSDFTKKNPVLDEFYSEREVDEYNKKFIVALPIGICGIFISVIILVATEPLGLTYDITTPIFIFIISIFVPIIVYFGILKDKYNIKQYNMHNILEQKLGEDIMERYADKESYKKHMKTEKWSTVIMLVATLIFLYLGFVHSMWSFAWIVFPIGGILCAIVDAIV